MSAHAANWPSWYPRTLTDRRNEITTVKPSPSIAGLAPRELSRYQSGIVDLTVTEGGQMTRLVRFTVQSTPAPPWLLRAVEGAGEMLVLPFDWDRQGAPPIDPAAIQTALDALCVCMDQHSSLPAWTPTRDGGVQLDWHENGIDLEIEFAPSSSDGYAVFADRNGGIAEWDGWVTSNLDSLRQVFSERLR